MAIRPLAGLVLAALFTTACDNVTQKKPETGSTTAGPASLIGAPANRSAVGTVQAPVNARNPSGTDAFAGERSIRLFGRGVSRQRQTRV
ncbi:MAG TPA: hypothetical protein VD867_00025 [Burkholderiales bacterium]|nr:hypothetical protein [Burkholderiales bacterium]